MVDRTPKKRRRSAAVSTPPPNSEPRSQCAASTPRVRADAERLEQRLLFNRAQFLPPDAYFAGDHPNGSVAADFNGDGNLDVAVSNYAGGNATGGGNMRLLLGDGSGSLNAAILHDAPVRPSGIAKGDFNRDGLPDLAVSSFDRDVVAIYLNNGSRNDPFPLGPNSLHAVGDTPNSLVVADFNGDGHGDIAVANTVPGNVHVLLGQGGGSFQPAVRHDAPYDVTSIGVGDFNGDDKPDLVVSSITRDNIANYLNNGGSGDPFPLGPTSSPPAGDTPGTLTVADFNGDGLDDLAVANSAPGNVHVLLASGGSFLPAIRHDAPFGVEGITSADFNGDGRPDLAASSRTRNNVAVYLHNGNAASPFSQTQDLTLPLVNSALSISAADLNHDDKPDLLVPLDQADRLGVLLNATPRTTGNENVNQTFTRDGVNVANGNLARNEADVGLTAVGVPLSFARHYNSQSSFDLGLGAGWSFTYGDYLEKVGNSAVVWNDAEGHQFPITFGRRQADVRGKDDFGQAVAVQPDGKIVVAGYITNGTGGSDLAVARFDADGGLDGTFGLDGLVTADVSSTDDYANAVAIDRHGRIVVGGFAGRLGAENEASFLVARFNSNGSLDSSFDPINHDGSLLLNPFGAQEDVVRAVLVDAQDRIVLAGYSGDLGGNSNFSIVRLLDNGQLDAGFDTDGYAIHEFTGGLDDVANAATFDSQGRIVLAGYSTNPGAEREKIFAVMRLRTDGSLDTSFQNDGHATLKITGGVGYDQAANAVAVDAQGRIVLAGYSNHSGQTDFALVRWLPNGDLDLSFDQDGSVHTDFFGGEHERANGIVIDSAGRIIAAGWADSSSSGRKFALAWYNNDGSPDTRADYDGRVTTPFDGNATATSIALAPDGRVVTAGFSYGRSGFDFALARYNAADGNLDGGLFGGPDVLKGSFSSDAAGYTYRDPSGFTRRFDAAGRLVSLSDRNSNGQDVSYDADGRIERVTDRTDPSRFLSFVHAGGHIASVSDFTGRTWVYGYAGQYLTSVTSPSDAQTPLAVRRYAYTTPPVGVGQLRQITDARGNGTVFTYDGEGRCVDVTDAAGNHITMSYDPPNHRTTVRDGRNNPTVYGYLDNGSLSSIQYADGPTESNTWANGRIVSRTDSLGRVEGYTYDANGNLVEKVDRAGQTSRSAYEPLFGNVISRTDANGHTTSYEHDARGNLTKVTDAVGNVTSTTYDVRGQMLTRTTPRGNQTPGVVGDFVGTFTYDAAGLLLTAVTDAPSSSRDEYDARGNLLRSTDALGRVTAYTYDRLNRVLTKTDAVGGVTRYAYDAAGNLLSQTDPLNRVTAYAYDANNRLVRVTTPDGASRQTAYDAAGNVASETDPLGRITTHNYDARNRRVRTTFPDQAVASVAYDAAGNITAQTDPLGRSTTYLYDALDRRVRVTDALGGISVTAYDAVGNVTSVTDPLGRVMRFEYDAANRQVRVLQPLGGVAETAYDANGNVRSVTDPLGRQTSYGYDALDRRVLTTDALGGITRTTFDAGGNITRIVDPLGRSTGYQYDALNRRIRAELDGAITSTTSYDAVGSITSVVDSLGRTTAFAYDAMNRLVRVTDAAGLATTSEYDAAGNVVAATDALGRRTTFGYDARNRRTTQTDALNQTTTTAFDAAGNAVSVRDPLGRITSFAYDALNRLIRTTDALNQVTATEYDASGNAIAVIDPLGRRTAYAYDALNRRVGVTDALGQTTATAYDAAGNVTSVTDELGRLTGYRYDALHRRIESTDALGHTSRTDYDAMGRVVATTDRLGRVTTYGYDKFDRVTVLTDPLGQVTRRAYDLVGNLTSETDPFGRVTTFAYDALNRRVRVMMPEATAPVVTSGAFDPAATSQPLRVVFSESISTASLAAADLVLVDQTTGAMVTAAGAAVSWDAASRAATWRFPGLADGNYRATLPAGAVSDAAGNPLSATFAIDFFVLRGDANRDRAVDVLDLGSLSSHYGQVGGVDLSMGDFNADGRVDVVDLGTLSTNYGKTLPVPTTAPPPQPTVPPADAGDGVTTTTAYDAVGNITAVTDMLGRTTGYAYDSLNRLVRATDALGHDTTTAYDAVGNVLAVTDQLGRRTTYAYDALNRRVGVTDALSNLTATAYDAAGNVTSVTDPLGHRTTYLYDALNRLVEVADAAGGITRTAYDAAGNVLSLTDPLTRQTTFEYDVLDRRIRSTSPLGNATNSEFDAAGNVIAVVDALGRRSGYSYDVLDRPIRVVDATGGMASTTYDAAGNVASVTDALGRRTSFLYDTRNRRVTVADPLGNVAGTAYDAVGNVTAAADPLGIVTRYAYDALDRQVSAIDALGQQTLTQYDAVGNVTRVTDPGGNATAFAYDALNRRTSEANALNAVRTFAYDAASNLTGVTDRNGRRRSFAYDAVNRRTSETWLGPTGNTIRTITSTYNLAGELTRIGDPDSTYAYTYDGDGRVITVDNAGTPNAPRVQLTYAYDAAGNRLTTGDAVNGAARGTVTATYDALNRTTRLTQSGAGVLPKRGDFTYDAASQLTGIRRFGELAGTSTPIATAYGYDEAGRLTSLRHTLGDATTLAQYGWTFDVAGRLVAATTPDGAAAYAYDATHQLTAADHSAQTDEAYAYDANGNRISGQTTGANNRLFFDGRYLYEYDGEGNRTRRTEIATGRATEYEWDHRNRLTAVRVRNPGGIASASTYTYDAYDRRIAKSVDADGAGPAAAVAERYAYDGQEILAQFDAAGAETHRYLHGPGTDFHLADQSAGAGAATAWLLTDHQGTVRDIANSAGGVLNHLAYDSFGRTVSQTNPAVRTIYGYTGRERDDESGLYYYRARYYDAPAGRFISEDPIGFAAGDTNLSRYVGNSPLVHTDPSGLFIKKVINAIGDAVSWVGDKISDVAERIAQAQRKAAEAISRATAAVGDAAAARIGGDVGKFFHDAFYTIGDVGSTMLTADASAMDHIGSSNRNVIDAARHGNLRAFKDIAIDGAMEFGEQFSYVGHAVGSSASFYLDYSPTPAGFAWREYNKDASEEQKRARSDMLGQIIVATTLTVVTGGAAAPYLATITAVGMTAQAYYSERDPETAKWIGYGTAVASATAGGVASGFSAVSVAQIGTAVGQAAATEYFEERDPATLKALTYGFSAANVGLSYMGGASALRAEAARGASAESIKAARNALLMSTLVSGSLLAADAANNYFGGNDPRTAQAIGHAGTAYNVVQALQAMFPRTPATEAATAERRPRDPRDPELMPDDGFGPLGSAASHRHDAPKSVPVFEPNNGHLESSFDLFDVAGVTALARVGARIVVQAARTVTLRVAATLASWGVNVPAALEGLLTLLTPAGMEGAKGGGLSQGHKAAIKIGKKLAPELSNSGNGQPSLPGATPQPGPTPSPAPRRENTSYILP